MFKITGLSAFVLILSAPAAQAASFISGPGAVSLDRTAPFTWTVNFSGASGAAATATFSFVSANSAGTSWSFNYTLDNTSAAPSLSSRLGVFGFDTTGTPSTVTTGSGNRFMADITGGNFNGLGNRDVCFYTGSNCNGSGNTGVTVSEVPVSGTFTLGFATGLNTLVLDSFAARWQAAGANADLSLSGSGTIMSPVPEPATWALMMIGFGLIGYAMRRRPTVRFAHD